MELKSQTANKGGYYHPHNRIASKLTLQAAYQKKRSQSERVDKQQEIPEVVESNGKQSLLCKPKIQNTSNKTEKIDRISRKKRTSENQKAITRECELPLKIDLSTPPLPIHLLSTIESNDIQIESRLDFLLTVKTVNGLGKDQLKRFRQRRERMWFGEIKERLVEEIATQLSAISYGAKLTQVLELCLIYREDGHFFQAMNELTVLFRYLHRTFPKSLRDKIESEVQAQMELFGGKND